MNALWVRFCSAILCLLALIAQVHAARATDFGVEVNPIHEKLEAAGMTDWLKARFSEIELEAMPHEQLRVESYACGCYDQPTRHFPYRIVSLKTPRGDLITRPEGQETVVHFIALAVRYGDLYCDAQSEESCYGTFAHPCDFTDFRYGRNLAPFFPTCRSDSDGTTARTPLDDFGFGP